MIWRHHCSYKERGGKSTARSRSKARLCIHKIFFYPSMVFGGKKSVFPLQRINTIALGVGGYPKLSPLWNSFPNFQLFIKASNVWHHHSTTDECVHVCVCASVSVLCVYMCVSVCLLHFPSKCMPQNPYIPTHWASTHTPPWLPQTQLARGHYTGGRPAHQTPSSPAQPSPRKCKGEGEWE